jgi:hypothetical protein
MDWFETLTGFQETNYADTRANLQVEGRRLRSLVNGKDYGIGELELVSLETLRGRVNAAGTPPGRLRVRVVTGDVRQMHRLPENAGALFQVASQFNLLEMISPEVTPGEGVARYQHDHTQGPACAIAAGAATIYRNYFVAVGGGYGQTRDRQIDGLVELGATLSKALGRPVGELWEMRNGYALCTRPGLDAIDEYVRSISVDQIDMLRGMLRIGLHRDVEVTDTDQIHPSQLVSQAFCSALPVAYGQVPRVHWKTFGSLVLEASYEATMWSAVLNAQRGASNIVLLTALGGGAFGNEEAWIIDAMRRALQLVSQFSLDVKIVSYGNPSNEIVELVDGIDGNFNSASEGQPSTVSAL